jgi:MYXO-CTERM domain-containing protein
VPVVQTAGGNGFATGVNLTQGSFMAGLQTLPAGGTPTVGTSAAPLLIVSGDGLSQFGTTYRLGTSKTATAVDRQFASTQFSTGANAQTVFAVLKYTFDSTNGDSAKLFLNPTPGGAEPAADLTVTAGTNLTLNTGIQSFFVRNNSVEPDTLWIDELRVGTTWEDVTPAVPEPAAGALALVGLCLSLLGRRRS